jgi:hypothetical protein
MDIATLMQLKRQELVDINLVRIYLQVCTISNIATAVGGSIHLLGKLNPSAIAGAIFHFLVKRRPRPINEDYGEKFFIIFYVPNHRQQTYV